MMSPPWRGILLGACTVIVAATALTAIEHVHGARVSQLREMFMTVCFVGILPALGTGAALGKLAEHIATYRRIILVALAATAVVVFGLLTTRSMIKVVVVPTVVAAVLLERWTRGPRVDARLTSTWRGVYLSIANVIAIALLIGVTLALRPSRENFDAFGFGFVTSSDMALPLTLIIVFVGLIPGVIVGAIAGRLAERFADRRRIVRLAILAGAALSLVALFGAWLGRGQAAVLASVPTLIATVVLERWTRASADAVPIARVLRPASPRRDARAA